MSLKAKNDDHRLHTLTDVVRVLGETRGEMHERFAQLEQKVDANQQENREHFDRQGKENAEIKEMLSAILARLPAN